MRATLCALLALAGITTGAETRVVISTNDVACRRGALRATADGAEIAREWSADVAVVLDPAHRWRVIINAASCWAPEAFVDPEQQVNITVWRAAHLRGATEPQARSLSARIKSKLLAETTVPCDVAGSKWDCVVPSTTLDVRLAAEGFVPHYLWDVTPHKDLGTLHLVRGASVAGWVSADDFRDVQVTLTPEAANAPRLELRRQTAKVNRRGFFQFAGVAADSYSLQATKAGFSPAKVSGVRVDEAREHVLRDALMLERLAALDVRIQPPMAPDGNPWKIELLRPIAYAQGLETVLSERANASGEWHHDGLEAGRYSLSVRDSKGSFASRDLDVRPGLPTVDIITSAIAVRGKLTAGDHPIAATIRLRNALNDSAELVSDDDGLFSGAVPSEGKWNPHVIVKRTESELWLKSVDIRRDKVLDLQLPDGRLRGVVVDESGHPLRAGVQVRDEHHPNGWIQTEADGTFEMIGLERGPRFVRARVADEGRDSGMIRIEIGDGEERVTITAPRKTAVRGWVYDAASRPRAGALIRYTASSFGNIEEAVTGPTGEFSLAVPASTSAVDAVVLAPGLPVKFVTLSTDAPAEVIVSRNAGRLRVRLGSTPPWPLLRRDGGFTALFNLLFPSDGIEPPRGLEPGGLAVDIEPGTYTLCPEARMSPHCVTRSVPLGGEAAFDAKELWK